MSGTHHLELAGVAGRPDSAVHRLDPRAKVVGLVGVTVVAVITPLALWPVYVACAAALALVALAAHVPAHTIARRALVVLPLILFAAVFIPFARPGGEALAVAAIIKALLGTTSAILLGATTTFPAILRALEAMRMPRLLTLMAGMTWRYGFLLVGDVGRMRSALVARGYRPRHALQAGALGRMTTALFLRTHSRAERVHLAMMARGFDGTMPADAPLRLARADVAFAGALLGTLLLVRIAVAT